MTPWILSGVSQNALVIFTSDNGYDLGEHELGDKRAAYEESMRIPLLVRAPFIPGTAGDQRDQMVLNVDIAPTMLDFAGVPIPKTMQSRSLRLLIEKKEVSDWPRSFLYEYFFERKALFPSMAAVRTDDAKLITYPGRPEWRELFRLDSDPWETVSLAGKPGALQLQNELGTELDRLKNTLSYVVPSKSDQDTYADDAKAKMLQDNKPPTTPVPASPDANFNIRLTPQPIQPAE